MSEIHHGLEINQVRPGTGLIIRLSDLQALPFSLQKAPLQESNQSKVFVQRNGNHRHAIVDIKLGKQEQAAQIASIPEILPSTAYRQFVIDTRPIKAMRRCIKCVLPETMPFIEFDDEGLCNFCHNYKQIDVLGQDELMSIADRYRSTDGSPDCLVTFSGGRDSSFGVHYVRTVLNMTPITYTYDWGMVTDLARRNQARLCGKLGLEHILISADIQRKRENIRKNVTAWLKKPDLGTVPLFMAGDKQYFYYANQLSKNTNTKLIILCENLLETTNFKSGFCGIPPAFGSSHTYTLSLSNKARLASYYGRQYLLNPSYFNASVLDTLGAFASYYVIPHNYLNLFNYVRWDEETIDTVLRDEYDWEVATDTSTTWRIGDGTAAFYNYIYFAIAGFSENDTFRSNQIREGMLSREQAMELIETENQPRFESIQWYCNTIGIDTKSALTHINQVPKLYNTQ